MTRLKSASVVVLSGLIILLALLGLAQIDFPMVLFMRSVHIPVLEQIGNVGNRLGHGETLIIICVALLLIGYARRKEAWRLAGIDGLVAHALAGIAVQIPKRLIGRPRPRWAHQEAFEFGPSFQEGLDAFPSGHAAASFAVAAVLARYFPRGAWLWYGAALFIGISRVIRGSHFLTDALAGAVLGFFVGYVWARPIKEWRISLLQAFPRCLPPVIVAFSMIWAACQKPGSGGMGMMLQWSGVALCFIGIGLRISRLVKRALPMTPLFSTFLGTASIGLGFALVSQSFFVVGLIALATPVWWMIHEETEEWIRPSYLGKEIIQACVLSALMVTLLQIQGLIPLVEPVL